MPCCDDRYHPHRLFHQGTQPLLVSMPHAGTYVPPALAAASPEARQVPDTDWHMERLYAFAKDMGASCSWPRIRATWSI